MTHLHITSWVVALILFVIVLSFMKKPGKEKATKIMQMILRLDYLLILFSGGLLFTNYFNVGGALLGESIVKVIAGFWVIYCMEMITTKKKNGLPTKNWSMQLGIAFIIALVLGLGRLPLGFAFFS